MSSRSRLSFTNRSLRSNCTVLRSIVSPSPRGMSMGDCIMVRQNPLEQEIPNREKPYSYDSSGAATTCSSTNDLPPSDRSRTESLDQSEDGSECEPGQQWTQVTRPTNARHNQKNKANLLAGVQSNGFHQPMNTCARSFHGPKDYNRIPRHLRASALPRNNSGLQNPSSLLNGTLTYSQPECSNGSINVKLEAATSAVQAPVISSSSSAITPPDLHSGLHIREDENSVRLQGSYLRGRKTFRQMGEVNDLPGRTLHYHQPSPPVCSGSGVTHTGTPQPNFVRAVCTHVSPTSITTKTNSQNDPGRRNPFAWRRPHCSMPYGARNLSFQRFHCPNQSAPRPYHNHSRYRPGVILGSNDASAELNDKVKESSTAVSSDTLVTSVKSDSVDYHPSATGKRTSWAAAVASAPPGAEKASASTDVCTESLQSQLLPFLLNQWQLFRGNN